MLTNDKEWVRSWIEGRTDAEFPADIMAAIGLVDGNDGLVAAVVYDHYTESCVTATIVIEKCKITRTMIRAMFRYPFEQLGVGKIIAYVNSANAASRKFVERLGFVIEGCIKDVYPNGDMLILGLVKSDCEWL